MAPTPAPMAAPLTAFLIRLASASVIKLDAKIKEISKPVTSTLCFVSHMMAFILSSSAKPVTM
jgi:hypothetical protein